MRRIGLLGVAAALGGGCVAAAPSTAADAPGPRHDPIAVTITTSPASPKAGQVVTFSVHVTSNDVGPLVTSWRYGDGSRVHRVTPGDVACFAAPTTPPEEAGASDATFRAMYRAAGTYTFTARAVHFEPCTTAYDDGTGQGTVTVTVRGPDRPANGPGSPLALADIRATSTGATVRAIRASDVDGLVRTVRVDYGDGAAAQTFPTGLTCHDPHRRWLPSAWSGKVQHVLAPGLHTLRLVVVSTGCAGRAVQRTTTVRSIEVFADGGFRDTADQTYAPPLRPGPPQAADP